MSRRCSHCGHNGHNSRTCLDMKGGGFKLFGVRVSADSEASVATECSSSSSAAMRKSFSMCNLSNYGTSEGGSPPPSASPQEQHEAGDVGDAVDGYASDDVVHTNSSSRERKKGVPWTEEEHRMFLIGLQKLGKGDWRGISRNFVKTRTPTQVASHAQKYFLRRNNLNKRRRRSSLFDMTTDSVSSLIAEPLIEESGCEDADICPELSLGQSIPYGSSQCIEASLFSRRMYPYSVPTPPLHAPRIPMTVSETAEELGEATESNDLEPTAMEEVVEEITPNVDMMESVPEVNDATAQTGMAQFPIPFSLVPMWPMQGFYATSNGGLWGAESKLVKPTPIIAKPPERTDDADNGCEMGTSTHRPVMEPTPLSYKLLEEHSKHSAFHSTAQATDSREIDGQVSNAISVP